jgi:hypothetical protein
VADSTAFKTLLHEIFATEYAYRHVLTLATFGGGAVTDYLLRKLSNTCHAVGAGYVVSTVINASWTSVTGKVKRIPRPIQSKDQGSLGLFHSFTEHFLVSADVSSPCSNAGVSVFNGPARSFRSFVRLLMSAAPNKKCIRLLEAIWREAICEWVCNTCIGMLRCHVDGFSNVEDVNVAPKLVSMLRRARSSLKMIYYDPSLSEEQCSSTVGGCHQIIAESAFANAYDRLPELVAVGLAKQVACSMDKLLKRLDMSYVEPHYDGALGALTDLIKVWPQ